MSAEAVAPLAATGAGEGDAPLPAVGAGELSAWDALAPLVRRTYRKLRREVDALDAEPSDEELHKVRIRAKRLRYACEAVAVIAGPESRRTARDAAALQTVLGDHHDAVVAERWLRDAAGSGRRGAGTLVTGQLIADERHAQRACRAEWRSRWERLARKKRRRWLRAGSPPPR